MIVRRLPDSELELYHHGIKGQRWGVRRYQNPDGSLTSAGRKHYGVIGKIQNDMSAKRVGAGAGVGAAVGAGVHLLKYGRRGVPTLHKAMARGSAVGAATEASRSAYNSVKRKKTETEIQNDSIRKQRKQKIKDRRTMSDEELKRDINRIKLEQEYKRVAEQDVKAGKKECDEIIKKIGSTVATSVLTATTLYTIKALLTKKFDVDDLAKMIVVKGKK